MTENEKKFISGTGPKHFQVKTLSPLHIGDTIPWQNDFDYIYHEKLKTILIIDFPDFLEKMDIDFLKKTNDQMDYQKKMIEMFKDKKLIVKRKYSFKEKPPQLYPFIHDHLSPLIPGSSLKGAFRTAVLSQLITQRMEKGETISVSPEKYLEKNPGTKNNIKMSMSAIQFPDLAFEYDKLKLVVFKTYSLGGGKNFIEKKKERLAEAIPPDIILKHPLTIRWSYREKDKTDCPGTAEIIDFSRTLQAHYQRWIKEEIKFIEANNKDKRNFEKITQVQNFYGMLLKKLDKGAILLNLGFGTGWQGKTGAFLKDNRYLHGQGLLEYLKKCDEKTSKSYFINKILTDGRYLKCPKNHNNLRIDWEKLHCSQCNRDYRLDELSFIYPFPKSRKFAFMNDQQKLFPSGWIQLIPLER